MNVGFIGLGKLGLACAEVIVEKGHTVRGYDIAPIKSKHLKIDSSIKEVVDQQDIVFIAVPTPHDPDYDGRAPTSHLEPKDFDYTTVEHVLQEANKYMNKDQLLVLISTVLPGTTRREFVQLVTNTRFVYNPYLIAMGTVKWDMVNPEMIMIGTEDGSETGNAKQLVEFYKTIMENNPRYVVGTWDECECIKVFYNTFISTKIGLVNMIQDVAQAQGNINVDVVTKALAESTQRIMGPAYMKAGMGDGGACHPRDNIALRYMALQLNLGYDLFAEIMKARELQAENMAREICKFGYEIYFTSDSYKPHVPYIEGSYSLLVQQYVNKFNTNITKDISRADVIVRVHETDEINEEELVPGVVIFDPWRTYVSTSEYHTVIHYGNTRHI